MPYLPVFFSRPELNAEQPGIITGTRTLVQCLSFIAFGSLADKTRKHRHILTAQIVSSTMLYFSLPWVGSLLHDSSGQDGAYHGSKSRNARGKDFIHSASLNIINNATHNVLGLTKNTRDNATNLKYSTANLGTKKRSDKIFCSVCCLLLQQ